MKLPWFSGPRELGPAAADSSAQATTSPGASATATANFVLKEIAPSKIIGIGVNYRAHAAEMGKPLPHEPLMFLKPPSALLAPGDAIVRPMAYDQVHFEGELAVVIGSKCAGVTAAEALAHVAGYTCMNDVTVRDLQKSDGQWARAKGFDTFAPIGPVIIAGLNPNRLAIKTFVNGALRQDSNTSDMVFDVAALIAFASRHMTLMPGDIITTGTPAGVGNLAPGDVVTIEIEGIGALTNPVIAGA